MLQCCRIVSNFRAIIFIFYCHGFISPCLPLLSYSSKHISQRISYHPQFSSGGMRKYLLKVSAKDAHCWQFPFVSNVVPALGNQRIVNILYTYSRRLNRSHRLRWRKSIISHLADDDVWPPCVFKLLFTFPQWRYSKIVFTKCLTWWFCCLWAVYCGLCWNKQDFFACLDQNVQSLFLYFRGQCCIMQPSHDSIPLPMFVVLDESWLDL